MNYKIGPREFTGGYADVYNQVRIWYEKADLKINLNQMFTLRDLRCSGSWCLRNFDRVADIKQHIIDEALLKIPKECKITIDGDFTIRVDGVNFMNTSYITLDDLLKIRRDTIGN